MGLYALALAALQAPQLAAQPASFDLSATLPSVRPASFTSTLRADTAPQLTAPSVQLPARHRPSVELKWRLKKVKFRMELPSI